MKYFVPVFWRSIDKVEKLVVYAKPEGFCTNRKVANNMGLRNKNINKHVDSVYKHSGKQQS